MDFLGNRDQTHGRSGNKTFVSSVLSGLPSPGGKGRKEKEERGGSLTPFSPEMFPEVEILNTPWVEIFFIPAIIFRKARVFGVSFRMKFDSHPFMKRKSFLPE
jgi:hypothetical protein